MIKKSKKSSTKATKKSNSQTRNAPTQDNQIQNLPKIVQTQKEDHHHQDSVSFGIYLKPFDEIGLYDEINQSQQLESGDDSNLKEKQTENGKQSAITQAGPYKEIIQHAEQGVILQNLEDGQSPAKLQEERQPEQQIQEKQPINSVQTDEFDDDYSRQIQDESQNENNIWQGQPIVQNPRNQNTQYARSESVNNQNHELQANVFETPSRLDNDIFEMPSSQELDMEFQSQNPQQPNVQSNSMTNFQTTSQNSQNQSRNINNTKHVPYYLLVPFHKHQLDNNKDKEEWMILLSRKNKRKRGQLRLKLNPSRTGLQKLVKKYEGLLEEMVKYFRCAEPCRHRSVGCGDLCNGRSKYIQDFENLKPCRLAVDASEYLAQFNEWLGDHNQKLTFRVQKKKPLQIVIV